MFFLIVELKMKKYQILALSVEQTAVWHPFIKKFAKRVPQNLDILMNFKPQTAL